MQVERRGLPDDVRSDRASSLAQVGTGIGPNRTDAAGTDSAPVEAGGVRPPEDVSSSAAPPAAFRGDDRSSHRR